MEATCISIIRVRVGFARDLYQIAFVADASCIEFKLSISC